MTFLGLWETWGRGGRPVDDPYTQGFAPFHQYLETAKKEEKKNIEGHIHNFCPVFLGPTTSRVEVVVTVAFLGPWETWGSGGRPVGPQDPPEFSNIESKKDGRKEKNHSILYSYFT